MLDLYANVPSLFACLSLIDSTDKPTDVRQSLCTPINILAEGYSVQRDCEMCIQIP